MRVVLLAILLCCLRPLAAVTWEPYHAGPVTVYAPAGHTALADMMAGMVAEELPRLARSLDFTMVRPFPVYVYTDQVAFYRDASPTPNLAGVSYRPSGLIRLDASGRGDPLRRTLAHEMTHTLLMQRLGMNISDLPAWVNEGIAEYLASPLDGRARSGAAQTVPRDGVLSLAELEGAFADLDGNHAAYQQSRAMVAWLEERHPGAIRRLLAHLAAGDSFVIALQGAGDITPQEWWQQWRQSVPAWVYWLPLLGSPLLYGLLGLLLVVVVMLRLLRRRDDDTADDEDGEDEEDEEGYVEAKDDNKEEDGEVSTN